MTAVNPDYTLLLDKNSVSLPITEHLNTQLYLTEYLNCYQHYKCSETYCLQKIKNVEKRYCYFHFSQMF